MGINNILSVLTSKTSLIIIGLLVVSVLVLFRFSGKSGSDNSSNSADKMSVKEVISAQDLNQEFSFPLRGDEGKELSKVVISVDRAEIRDEIIVQGKKVASTKGRTFLVLNLRVKNDYNQSISVNTRDYFRLAVGGNEEDWLAPDIHNDPVEVQAISTKPTRVAFPVDEGVKSFKLTVGEIEGEKQTVEFKF